MHRLLRNVDAGYRAIWVSADVPVLGRRLGEMRTNFTLPEDLSFPNILSTGGDEFGSVEMRDSGPKAYGELFHHWNGQVAEKYQMTRWSGRRSCRG